MNNVINWNYERGSWQWDVLCIVILIFIFLTPKEWFGGPKTAATQMRVSTVEAKTSGFEFARE